jgi:hypothetical protein
MTDDFRTEPRVLATYLSSNYSQLQGLIKHADTKANIMIALIGGILSVFFNFFMSESNDLPLWQIITILGLLLISGAFSIATLYPRTSRATGNFSLIYFKDAQSVDIDKWTKKFLKSDQEEAITKDMITNIKNISSIVDRKFLNLRFSYILFGLSILIKIIFDLITFL